MELYINKIVILTVGIYHFYLTYKWGHKLIQNTPHYKARPGCRLFNSDWKTSAEKSERLLIFRITEV